MKLLVQRYLAAQLLLRFAFCMLAGLAFFLLADLFENARILPEVAGALDLAWLYLLKIPVFSYQTLPLALLLAVLLTFGHLARTNELTALLVAGRDPLRLCAGMLVIAAACGLLMFALAEAVMPPATRALDRRLLQLTGRPHNQIYRELYRPQRWYRGREGRVIYYVGESDPAARRFTDVRIFTLDRRPAIVEVVEAAELRWRDGTWTARDGYRRTFGSPPTFERFERRVLDLAEAPETFSGALGSPDGMTAGQLAHAVELRRRQGYGAVAYELALQRRFSRPASALLVCLLVLPLGLRTARGHEVAVQLAKGSVVASGYIGLELLGAALGGRGLLPAWLGVWFPNLVLLGLGLPLWWRVRSRA